MYVSTLCHVVIFCIFMDTAVLLLVFNRPSTTRRVFEVVRKARPKRLYIAADGPRAGREDDANRCEESRAIVTAVDWPCEVKTLFRDTNLGCRLAVGGALDWFFGKEESGIVLEDDCLPGISWFRFAEEMLTRFRYDERVMCISADNFYRRKHKKITSYYFSIYNHCWGWATWRRAWKNYDGEMKNWPELRNTDWLLRLSYGDKKFERYWKEIFDVAYEGVEVDSWAYRWTFSCWMQNGLTVLPERNLVLNIGFGNDATHTRERKRRDIDHGLEAMHFPLNHPDAVVRDVLADKWTTRNVFGANRLRWIVKKMRVNTIAKILRQVTGQKT